MVDGVFIGGGAQADILNTENNLKINDIVSWTHKHHYIKFGVNIPNLSRRAWEDHSNRLGTFSFSSLAAYDASTPYSFTQQAGIGRTVFWMNEIGIFIQDEVQVRPNIRVSSGCDMTGRRISNPFTTLLLDFSLAYTTQIARRIRARERYLFYDRSGAPSMADLNAITVSFSAPSPCSIPATRARIHQGPTLLAADEPGADREWRTHSLTSPITAWASNANWP